MNPTTTRKTALTVLATAALALTFAVSPMAAAGTANNRPSPATQGVIVWTQRTADGSGHLLIARADASHQRVLTPAIPDSEDFDAQISPAGDWIAYEHDTANAIDEIHLIRPNGQGDHVLDIGCVDPCGLDGPTWLSNSQLAFLKVVGPLDDQGNAASAVLWTARPDGSHPRRLSEPGIDGTYEDRYARLSGDGRYLTFQRAGATGVALFRMELDGTKVRQLTPWDLQVDLYDLSTTRHGPTHDLIAFQTVGRGDPNATFADIGFVPATCVSLADCTAKIVWMTDNGATGRRTSNPQWSPDGSSLAFADRSSINEPNAEVWTMRFGGTEPERRNISNSLNFDFRPAWGTTAGSMER